jgi:CDP-paratose 2-epimerase
MTGDAPILVTGGAGFIGSNLADRLAGEGHEVLVYDNLSRPGVERNLSWLKDRHGHRIVPIVADVRDAAALSLAAREAQAVFHMAAQVAVTTSLKDPRGDLEINVLGTFNLLEAVRQKEDETPVIFASTNKVYGELAEIDLVRGPNGYRPTDQSINDEGVSEAQPLEFYTPYGVSKGAADQYVLDYARSFGLPAAAFRMSCIYGSRQMGTEDQGWVAHFLIRALAGESITLYGDGYQVRDILDVSDAVDAYVRAWRGIDVARGRAFNLGGGPGNAVSLRSLVRYIGQLLGREPEVRFADWRSGDQRYFVADTRVVGTVLDWRAEVPWQEGVARLADWLAKQGPASADSRVAGFRADVAAPGMKKAS